ncbi:MAG: Holliday junction resolvase RuvX [Clostridiales bacterium]|jgi:putative Holliday junction resolvase|nr:Holliday junction resolvase RuvX [Clostridiales bacterium]
MRKIGLDIGDARIGVAVSDVSGIIASPRETYSRQNPKKDAAYFKNLAETENADEIVLGLPVNMDGTKGARAASVAEYGEMLRSETGVAVVYIDERLTTVQAEKALIASDMRRDKRKLVIDKVAASIILQAYLDKIRRLR